MREAIPRSLEPGGTPALDLRASCCFPSRRRGHYGSMEPIGPHEGDTFISRADRMVHKTEMTA